MPINKIRKGPIDVRFNNVSFSYAAAINVLENVNLHVHHGEFVALVGPNGSGKTTALKLLLGLEKPGSGSVILFEGSPGDGLERIGYVPQHSDYDPTFPITVNEVVKMGRLKSLSRKFVKEDEGAVVDAMEIAEVSDLAKRKYSALSGGQRRRVMVARALASRPRLLILDEPTANMDSESEARLYQTLGSLKGNTTIIIVTHDPTFVSSLTDVVFCVGDRHNTGEARTVVMHPTEEVHDGPQNLYGGKLVKIQHNEKLNDSCCGKGETE